MHRRLNIMKKIMIFIFVLCVIGIGYAFLTSSFIISGNTKISMSNWDVHFENLNIKDGSISGSNLSIPDGTTTSLQWNAALDLPGDFLEFTVDVVNSGSLDAMIGSIEILPILTANERKVLRYNVLYSINNRVPMVRDVLSAGDRLEITVRVLYRQDVDINDLEYSGFDKNMRINIEYVQADGTERGVGFGINKLLEKVNPATVTSYTAGNTSEMYTFEQPATAQLDATTDYRYIGETNCSYDDGAYWVPQRAGGACANIYKKDASGTITYEASCTEDGETTCTLLSGTLKEIKNYIEYNNEMWRIIGLFDGKLKIIKDVGIGNYAYDNKQANVGSSDRNRGSNDWSDSRIMYFLNAGNYGKDTYSKVGNYIYDDKEPANLVYEIGKVQAKVSGSFIWQENSWKLNDKAWSQAVAEKYFLGAAWNTGSSAEAKYITERGTARPGALSTRPTNWTGKVGLMYPSDYSYTFAMGVNDQCYTTPSKCNTAPGNMYTSWLARNDTDQWTITPHTDGGDQRSYTWRIMTSGSVYSYYCDMEYSVRPVVYLKSDILISGQGTKTNPYKVL